MGKVVRKIGFSFNEKYVSQALTEIKESSEGLRNAGIRFIGSAKGGFQLAEYTVEEEALLEELRGAKLIFVRHCCAFDYEWPLIEIEGGDSDNPWTEQIDSLSSVLKKQTDNKKFSVQSRGFTEGEREVLEKLRFALESSIQELGFELDVKHPEQIITLCIKDGMLLAGVGSPEENLSRWSGGMAHYKQEPWEISRSMYKLLEAFEVFPINIEAGQVALDLGAAPGGWTSVLIRKGMRVISVDTGELDDTLKKERAVEFRQENAAELDLGERKIDFLVSDMSWNPAQTARLVCRAAKWLKSGGEAVVTVKLLNGKPVKSLKETSKIYEEVFEVLDARQLFHNREEVTLYLRKR